MTHWPRDLLREYDVHVLLAGLRLFTADTRFCVVLYSEHRLVIALTAAVRAAPEER